MPGQAVIRVRVGSPPRQKLQGRHQAQHEYAGYSQNETLYGPEPVVRVDTVWVAGQLVETGLPTTKYVAPQSLPVFPRKPPKLQLTVGACQARAESGRIHQPSSSTLLETPKTVFQGDFSAVERSPQSWRPGTHLVPPNPPVRSALRAVWGAEDEPLTIRRHSVGANQIPWKSWFVVHWLSRRESALGCVCKLMWRVCILEA